MKAKQFGTERFLTIDISSRNFRKVFKIFKKNNFFILNQNFKKIAYDLEKNKELLVYFEDKRNQNNYLAKTLEFLNEH